MGFVPEKPWLFLMGKPFMTMKMGIYLMVIYTLVIFVVILMAIPMAISIGLSSTINGVMTDL